MVGSVVGPRLKLERAKRHIDELAPLVRDFLAGNPYEIIEETDPETGKHSARVKIHADPDPGWSLVIGDAIHNLRSALDLLYYQLVIANRKTPSTRDEFLISNSEADFHNGARPILWKRVGNQAFEIIRDRVKPYRGGNNALWCLHQLDIVDKHRLLLVLGSASPALIVAMKDTAGDDFASLTLPTTTPWPLKDGDNLPAPTIVGQAGEPELEVKFKAPFVVTFYEPSIIGVPESLALSLGNMAGAVEATIGHLAPLLSASHAGPLSSEG